MKLVSVTSVLFFLLASFGVKNSVEIKIDGEPGCMVSKTKYTIRLISPIVLSDDETLQLWGGGLALTPKGRNVYNGMIGTADKVSLRVFIYTIKTKKRKLVTTRIVKVCE